VLGPKLTTKGFDTAGVTLSMATSWSSSPRLTANAISANLLALALSIEAVSFLSAINTSGKCARPACRNSSSTAHLALAKGDGCLS
jgi:hypothetical protein